MEKNTAFLGTDILSVDQGWKRIWSKEAYLFVLKAFIVNTIDVDIAVCMYIIYNK